MKEKNKYILAMISLISSFIILFVALFFSEYIPLRHRIIIISLITMAAMLILIISKKSIWRFFTALSIVFVSLYFISSQLEINKLSPVEKYELVDYDLVSYEGFDSAIKAIGFYGVRANHHEQVLSEFSDKIKFINYDNVQDLSKDLEDDKIQAFLLNANLLPDVMEDESFSDKSLSQLNRYSIKVGSGIKAKEVNVLEEPFLVYLSGIDVFGDVVTRSRSDMNLMMAINPVSNEILSINIPRDTYLRLGCQGNEMDKLTHAGLYGVDCSMKTLEKYFSFDFNYYVRINFTGLLNLVDALGGVDVEASYAFTSDKGTEFVKGMNHVNGQEALEFARERNNLEHGDIDRGLNHQKLLEAIMNKMLNEKNIYSLPQHLPLLRNVLDTNLSDQDLSKLISNQISNKNKWTVNEMRLEGYGDMQHTYSQDKRYKYYVYWPAENSKKNIVKEVKRVMNDAGK